MRRTQLHKMFWVQGCCSWVSWQGSTTQLWQPSTRPIACWKTARRMQRSEHSIWHGLLTTACCLPSQDVQAAHPVVG